MNDLPRSEVWLARRSIAELLKSNTEWQIHWKEVSAQSVVQKASVGPEDWALFLPR
jgi:hypothetical protein